VILDQFATAESLISTQNIVHKIKGVLLFNLVILTFQKLVFIAMKLGFLLGSGICRNPVIGTSVAFNALSIAVSVLFFLFKQRQMVRNKELKRSIREEHKLQSY